MTITEYLQNRSTVVLIPVGLLLLGLVSAADYITHINYVLEFSPFYLVPVSFFSWFIGRQAGLVIALASATVGTLIRFQRAPHAIAYWDALVLLALYVTSALMISQLKKLYQRERELSRMDPLTEIANRRAFFESAAALWGFTQREKMPFSIAYLDVDEFKQLNDRYGHAAGDRLLAVTAASIRQALRGMDVVARMGGDEFALLLPAAEKETAAQIVDRVRRLLDEAVRQHGWAVTFSVGLVTFFPPLRPLSEMIQAADTALYRAKTSGKNRIEQKDIVA
jgi:diguanylate cyclase (GGDEF)-like protein